MLKGKASLDLSKVSTSESNDSVESHPSTSKDEQKKPEKPPKSVKGTSTTVKTPAAKAPDSNPIPHPSQLPVSQTQYNKEVMHILRDLNNNLSKQNEKVEAQNERIDKLFQKVESFYQNDEQQFDGVDYNYDDCYESDSGEPCESGSVHELELEPPTKKAKTDDSSVFKALYEKFQNSESTDSEVDENLAEIINHAFRNGLSDEKLSELLKDIYRPVNCSALVKTRVNQGIWRLLKATTQTDDSKMQAVQNVMIKSAACISKLLNKNADVFDSQDMEWGTNALALMGQANKLINNRRKEMHKPDLDPKYHYLCSSSLPYTEFLYGEDGDVNKNVREINDLNRIGRNVSRGQRSGFRGRRPFGSRRGRGAKGSRFFRSSENQSSGTQYTSKNQKSGPKK